MALMSACSSSPTSDGLGEDELPKDGDLTLADASTDAVPQDMLEKPEAKAEDVPMPTEDKKEETPPVADTSVDNAFKELSQSEPESTPPAVAPVESSHTVSTSGESESYTVQRGDTLMKIAFEQYGDLYKWKDIYDWNRDKISSPNSVAVGTSLKLEKAASPVSIDRNGEKYLIKQGDTLGKISDDIYGTKAKWKKLWENNRQLIKDPNRIFAGFYLYYTISPEEMQDRERLKQQVSPAPLVQNQEPAPAPAPDVAAPGQREPAQSAQAQPGIVEAAPSN